MVCRNRGCIITFHLEATDEPEKAIQMIKNYGLKSGISLKPDSDINRLIPFANMVDQILVMAVEPVSAGKNSEKIRRKESG